MSGYPGGGYPGNQVRKITFLVFREHKRDRR